MVIDKNSKVQAPPNNFLVIEYAPLYMNQIKNVFSYDCLDNLMKCHPMLFASHIVYTRIKWFVFYIGKELFSGEDM